MILWRFKFYSNILSPMETTLSFFRLWKKKDVFGVDYANFPWSKRELWKLGQGEEQQYWPSLFEMKWPLTIFVVFCIKEKSKNLSLNRNPKSRRRNGASPMWSLIIRWKRGQTRSKFVSWRRFRNLNESKSTSFGKSSKAAYFPHFFSLRSNLLAVGISSEYHKLSPYHYYYNIKKHVPYRSACRPRYYATIRVVHIFVAWLTTGLNLDFLDPWLLIAIFSCLRRNATRKGTVLPASHSKIQALLKPQSKIAFHPQKIAQENNSNIFDDI